MDFGNRGMCILTNFSEIAGVAAGDVVEVLVGITNHGRKTYNITSLYAYLKHPEHGIYVQNVCLLVVLSCDLRKSY